MTFYQIVSKQYFVVSVSPYLFQNWRDSTLPQRRGMGLSRSATWRERPLKCCRGGQCRLGNHQGLQGVGPKRCPGSLVGRERQLGQGLQVDRDGGVNAHGVGRTKGPGGRGHRREQGRSGPDRRDTVRPFRQDLEGRHGARVRRLPLGHGHRSYQPDSGLKKSIDFVGKVEGRNILIFFCSNNRPDISGHWRRPLGWQ